MTSRTLLLTADRLYPRHAECHKRAKPTPHSEHQIKGCIEVSGLNPEDCKLHWVADLDEAREWLRAEQG